MLRASERRRSSRHPVRGPVDFRIENWHLRRGRILNLCLEGCLIEPHPTTDCVPGDTLELRFEVRRLPFRVRAEVRRIGPAGRLGVEIIETSPRSHARLLEILGELDEDNGPG